MATILPSGKALLMLPYLYTAALLVCSNVFTTFGRYAHLKNLAGRRWIIAARVSCATPTECRLFVFVRSADLRGDRRIAVEHESFVHLDRDLGEFPREQVCKRLLVIAQRVYALNQ